MGGQAPRRARRPLTLLVAFYLIGVLMIGVRVTMCEDRCEADMLAAASRKL